jgi:hypothetical protein
MSANILYIAKLGIGKLGIGKAFAAAFAKRK